MSTQAFGSRRVLEALNELGNYLDDAAKSAARIPVGGVARLEIDDGSQDLGPRLNAVSIVPDKNGSATTEFDVEGSNLNDVHLFKLVKGTVEVIPDIVDVPPRTDDGFTATLHQTLARGHYDALVVDDGGQAFVLRNAVWVEGPKKHSPPSQPDHEKVELLPNSVERGTRKKSVNIALTVREVKDVDEVYVEQDGNRIKELLVLPVRDADARGWKPYGFREPLELAPQRHLRLKMVIPKNTSAGLYHVVAKLKAIEPEVRLAFYIR